MTGVVVGTVGILISAMPPASATVAVGVAVPATPAVGPGEAHDGDADVCLAASAEVEAAALAVEQHRRDRTVAAASRLRVAEARLGAVLEGAEPRLGTALRKMRDAIAGLRVAIESGSRVARATDAVLARIDDLGAICQARLRPQPSPVPP